MDNFLKWLGHISTQSLSSKAAYLPSLNVGSPSVILKLQAFPCGRRHNRDGSKVDGNLLWSQVSILHVASSFYSH